MQGQGVRPITLCRGFANGTKPLGCGDRIDFRHTGDLVRILDPESRWQRQAGRQWQVDQLSSARSDMIEMGVKAAMDNDVGGSQDQPTVESSFLIAASKHHGDVATPMMVARDAPMRIQPLTPEMRRMEVLARSHLLPRIVRTASLANAR